MEYDAIAEVSVKDIVNFYIKINDSSRAKSEISKLSAKDRAAALAIIASSRVSAAFRIDIAAHFCSDPDSAVRRRAELIMKDMPATAVRSMAEVIVTQLNSATGTGVSRRRAAVKLLAAIGTSNYLGDLLPPLLQNRGSEMLSDIMAVAEEYVVSCHDEAEQLALSDVCLELLASDQLDAALRVHTLELLDRLVAAMPFSGSGALVRRKPLEHQLAYGESICRSFRSCRSLPDSNRLEAVLGPLYEGGRAYQIRVLSCLKELLEKSLTSALPAVPLPTLKQRDPKIRDTILKGVEELWGATEEGVIRFLTVKIRFLAYADKRLLLETIGTRLGHGDLNSAAQEKLAAMLRCFLFSDQPDELKLQAAELLLFTLSDLPGCRAVLEYLACHIEQSGRNDAGLSHIVTIVESLLSGTLLPDSLYNKARYLLFLIDSKLLRNEEELKSLFGYVRDSAEAGGFADGRVAERVCDALAGITERGGFSGEAAGTAQHLAEKIRSRNRG